MNKGIGGHTAPNKGATDTWLTPPEIIKALGEFDLDPCCPLHMPWRTAKEMWSEDHDGLGRNWHGRVWLNPPYSNVELWMNKMSRHQRGIALVFARTEVAWFHDWVWPFARGALFLKGRLHFHHADGTRAKGNAGGPHVLLAYSMNDAYAMEDSIAKERIEGRMVYLR